jgi:hypothetical protein
LGLTEILLLAGTMSRWPRCALLQNTSKRAAGPQPVVGAEWDDSLIEGATPYQHVTLLTADRAVFRDDVGHEVVLLADGSARPEPCD